MPASRRVALKGDEFRATRERLRLTQTELGERLGLSLRFVRYIEKDEREIDGRTELAMRWLAEHGKPAHPAPGRGAVPGRGPRSDPGG